MVVVVPPGMMEVMVRYSVKEMMADKSKVPANSMPTADCIEKQNVPLDHVVRGVVLEDWRDGASLLLSPWTPTYYAP